METISGDIRDMEDPENSQKSKYSYTQGIADLP